MSDCLGISWLGQCGYSPTNPAISYFTVGEMVAALSITLLLPQFLKPIYQFRLRAQSLGQLHIYGAVFLGSACVLVAALIPQVGLGGRTAIGYPILWELLAGCLFFVAFAVLAWSTLRPATAKRHRAEKFVREAADFLAHASDADRADFARDLYHNIGRLAEAAEWVERARHQSAFLDFVHRHDIEDGGYAAPFFSLIAEAQFCETLVRRAPWDTAAMMGELSQRPRIGRSDIGFVQELGRQAIISPGSMMAREIGYTGFVAAPVLSEALFHDPYIGRRYEPLDGLRFDDFSNVDVGMLERYFHAVEKTLDNILSKRDYWGDRSLARLADNLRWIGYDIRKQTTANRQKYDLTIKLKSGFEDLIRQTREHLATVDGNRYGRLFVQDPDDWHYMAIETIATAIVNLMGSYANDYAGFDDAFWSTSFEVFGAVFDRFGDLPDGMDPLQQRVAIKMIKEVNNNMKGFYPALTRVLLPLIGPYDRTEKINPKSAYALLRDAFYAEMKLLPELHKRQPEKVGHYLPPSIRYDADSAALTQVYRDGKEVATNLRSLELAPISFIDPSIRRNPRSGPQGAPSAGSVTVTC